MNHLAARLAGAMGVSVAHSCISSAASSRSVRFIGVQVLVSALLTVSLTASHYSGSTQSFTSLGGLQQSATYAQRSTGGEIIVGDAPVAASAHYRIRPGHIGQSVEVISLEIGFLDSPADLIIRENTSRRLSVTVAFDDGTSGDLLSTDIKWQVRSGALTTPDTTGALYAMRGPSDTTGVIEGTYLGINKLLTVFIADVINHYGDWQTNYFTSSQIASDPLTRPEASFSKDGIANLVKYALGLDPSRTFTGSITAADIEHGRISITFHRYLRPDLTYAVEASEDLANWTTLWSAAGESGPGGEITVYDTVTLGTSASRRFLRLNFIKD
jgi:hypothetical protein